MSNRFRHVYLAGPVAFQDWDKATGWRQAATKVLAKHDIVAVNPLRGVKKDKWVKNSVLPEVGVSAEMIYRRDKADVMSCDAVLLHMPSKISHGSLIELGWASACNIPVVCTT